MYSNFVFLDQFLLSYRAKTHTHTHTNTHTHRDSNEYPIVAFSKNATIIRVVNEHVLSDFFVIGFRNTFNPMERRLLGDRFKNLGKQNSINLSKLRLFVHKFIVLSKYFPFFRQVP